MMLIMADASCVRICSCWFVGKDVDDSVDRSGGTRRVEGSEDDVARFGRGNGCLDRFEVSHFADEDNVRILSQGAADGFGETR